MVADLPAPPVEDAAPFGQALQSLGSLMDMMRDLSPEGGSAHSPKLALSPTGLEVRLEGAAVEQAPAAAAAETTLLERVSRFENSLQQLSDRIGKLEEKLGADSEAVAYLRTAVQQNDEMIETLVNSISMMDEFSQSGIQ